MSWQHAFWKTLAAGLALAGEAVVRPGLRILSYHAVGTELPGDPYGLSMPPDGFQRQMELLATGRFGAVVSLSQARLDGLSPEVCVTFDDGYLDTLSTAAPVLARLKLPFTVCVTPKLLESGAPHMTPGQLKELALMPGAEIGAHGFSHRSLPACDDAALKQELSDSRAWLQSRLGKPVTVMTYPHGHADQRVRKAAETAGFLRAGCSRYALNGPDRDPLLLCRTEIVAWDTERTFVQKVSGGWDFFRFRHTDPARIW
ncbi:MAG: polysaccharide deacetylase family protein [Elusimicrobiota bacterium]